MSKRERAFAVLPTLLTLGNALCGFAAITYAARLGIEDVQAGDAHLLYASMCIFAGMLFDALDGRAARWANQTSEFGAQLDSLCDVVTFGVAPAFLMRQFSLQSVVHPRIMWVIAGLYVACAILRLARFTIETDDEDSHESFSGLPSPAAAGAVASFPVAMYGLGKLTAPGENISEFARRMAAWLEPALLEVLPDGFADPLLARVQSAVYRKTQPQPRDSGRVYRRRGVQRSRVGGAVDLLLFRLRLAVSSPLAERHGAEVSGAVVVTNAELVGQALPDEV